jgi:hypothetical protein
MEYPVALIEGTHLVNIYDVLVTRDAGSTKAEFDMCSSIAKELSLSAGYVFDINIIYDSGDVHALLDVRITDMSISPGRDEVTVTAIETKQITLTKDISSSNQDIVTNVPWKFTNTITNH